MPEVLQVLQAQGLLLAELLSRDPSPEGGEAVRWGPWRGCGEDMPDKEVM